MKTVMFGQFCSVLEKRHIGAKRDSEIWAFKILTLDQKESPKVGFVGCPTWKIKIKKNHEVSPKIANGSPLEAYVGLEKEKK